MDEADDGEDICPTSIAELIVDGQDAALKEFPHMASEFYQAFNHFFVHQKVTLKYFCRHYLDMMIYIRKEKLHGYAVEL